MPLTTTSAAIHITPTVLKTFFRHYVKKISKKKRKARTDEATDDILFDQAFHIVKSFIELAVQNTVESLQAFTNTHIPAPPWVAVSPVLVPLSSCNNAADSLIEWFKFGREELKKVVGGERWWQVRGLDGVEAEWITQKKFIGINGVPDNIKRNTKRHTHESNGTSNLEKMNKLRNVMLYVHGGAYYWGSINTHRYQLIRYAKKIRGRVFAVNYRKAPQYPWPCALQDVLAAYLYLIRPPRDSPHSAISNTQIVIAGDSAGAGLCLTVLTIIRDLNLPMPAGAVLISPWVDMTHSFPSVMKNKYTDISPPYGFMNKPSTVWPVDPIPKEKGRIIETDTNPPPEPGHADTLKPDKARVENEPINEKKVKGASQMSVQDTVNEAKRLSSQSTDCKEAVDSPNINVSSLHEAPHTNTSDAGASQEDFQEGDGDWRPRPPKVLMEDPKTTPLELRSQIQHYATNEQLCHPLVSPVLQGSLGNLCPLYIIAGDGEALRDEIVYMAHRAAHPDKYPPRKEILKDFSRQEDNVRKFTRPTPVRLDVFDGMCHVLTVFTFTASAKYAYEEIAKFTQHVIHSSRLGQSNIVASDPFPEVSGSPSGDSSEDEDEDDGIINIEEEPNDTTISTKTNQQVEDVVTIEREKAEASENTQKKSEVTLRSGHSSDGTCHDGTRAFMIRQRVDVHGRPRDMEPEDSISVLQLSSKDIGLIREAPARRWLDGQAHFDKKFRALAPRIIKKRRKYENRYEKYLSRMEELGFIHETKESVADTPSNVELADGRDVIQKERRWGPLDLSSEDPPPTAIAKRKDTLDALALLKKNVYHSAPATTKFVPQLQTIDAVKAAFDPEDSPTSPPQQSASEQQQYAESAPMHGLKIWASIMTVFVKQSSYKTKTKIRRNPSNK